MTTLIPILIIISEIYPYTSPQLSAHHAYVVFLLRCQDFTKIFDLHGDGVIRADEFLDFGRQIFGVDLWKVCYPLLMDIQVIWVIWFLYYANEIVIAGSITLYGIQTHPRSTFFVRFLFIIGYLHSEDGKAKKCGRVMIQGWLLYESLVISIIILTQQNL